MTILRRLRRFAQGLADSYRLRHPYKNACHQAHIAERNRARLFLDATPEPCGCEQVPLSGVWPGRVRDDESLCFLVPHPDGLFANGKPNQTFFTQLFDNGLSVLREDARTKEFEITLRELEGRWSAKARRFHGVLRFTAGRARRTPQDERLSCVLDTRLKQRPHHADIVALPIVTDGDVTPKKLQTLQMKRIKLFLENAAMTFEQADNFRKGALAHFAKDMDAGRETVGLS